MRVARGAGIWWWWQRRSSWLGKSATTSSATTASQFPSLDSINTDASAREVDYPIVESRLRAVDDLMTSRPEVSADARSQPGFLFELYTIEARDGDDRPQELESATMDLVLGCASLAAPHGVSLLGIDSATKSGQLVLTELKQIATGRRKCAARVACVQLVAVRNIIEIQPLLDALQNSSLTSLSLAGAGIGVEVVTAIATVIPTMAASLQWIVIGNKATRIPLHNSEITALDVSDQELGPGEVTVVAAAISTYAVVKEVTVSGNPLTGGEPKWNRATKSYDQTDGKYISGVSVLFSAMTRVITLNVSNCGLGPTAMPELAKLVCDASAVLKKVTLSQNKLFGVNRHGRHTIDADQSGWAALCDALPSSQVEGLDVTDVGMGVKGVTSLAKAMSAGAVLEAVNLDGNYIDAFGFKTVVEGAVSVKHLSVSSNPICCTSIS
eukprot:SAG25_NODE_1274_length_3426_cov_2.050496_3_plen_439_part_01